ncbi:hypothetical protein NQZ68_004767 [Dissostichus eleginoides]|nr:hypothetical protein NQZ68_004767 [Dissostichus eleginoides]
MDGLLDRESVWSGGEWRRKVKESKDWERKGEGQCVAARTAEVKRLSVLQQKQLMFPNNQAFVGGFQC